MIIFTVDFYKIYSDFLILLFKLLYSVFCPPQPLHKCDSYLDQIPTPSKGNSTLKKHLFKTLKDRRTIFRQNIKKIELTNDIIWELAKKRNCRFVFYNLFKLALEHDILKVCSSLSVFRSYGLMNFKRNARHFCLHSCSALC